MHVQADLNLERVYVRRFVFWPYIYKTEICAEDCVKSQSPSLCLRTIIKIILTQLPSHCASLWRLAFISSWTHSSRTSLGLFSAALGARTLFISQDTLVGAVLDLVVLLGSTDTMAFFVSFSVALSLLGFWILVELARTAAAGSCLFDAGVLPEFLGQYGGGCFSLDPNPWRSIWHTRSVFDSTDGFIAGLWSLSSCFSSELPGPVNFLVFCNLAAMSLTNFLAELGFCVLAGFASVPVCDFSGAVVLTTVLADVPDHWDGGCFPLDPNPSSSIWPTRSVSDIIVGFTTGLGVGFSTGSGLGLVTDTVCSVTSSPVVTATFELTLFSVWTTGASEK